MDEGSKRSVSSGLIPRLFKIPATVPGVDTQNSLHSGYASADYSLGCNTDNKEADISRLVSRPSGCSAPSQPVVSYDRPTATGRFGFSSTARSCYWHPFTIHLQQMSICMSWKTVEWNETALREFLLCRNAAFIVFTPRSANHVSTATWQRTVTTMADQLFLDVPPQPDLLTKPRVSFSNARFASP